MSQERNRGGSAATLLDVLVTPRRQWSFRYAAASSLSSASENRSFQNPIRHMIFEIAQDYHDTLVAFPPGHCTHRLLECLAVGTQNKREHPMNICEKCGTGGAKEHTVRDSAGKNIRLTLCHKCRTTCMQCGETGATERPVTNSRGDQVWMLLCGKCHKQLNAMFADFRRLE